MKRFLLPVYIVLIFIISATRGYAQESIMQDISYPFLEKLIATARQNYPQVKIRQAQVNIAQNNYTIAKKSWYDFFSFSYVYSPQTTLNLAATSIYTSLFQGYQIAISLNIGTIIEKPYNIKVARENYTISQLEQQDYDLALELDVKTRYFTYIRQSGLVRLRTHTSQDAESVLSLSRHRFESGTETIDDYTKATVAFAENNQAKIDAEAEALIAKSSLEQIIGKKLEEVK